MLYRFWYLLALLALKRNSASNIFSLIQQQSIIASIVMHPVLIDEFEEQILEVEFSNDLRLLAQKVLSAFATLADPTPDAMRKMLLEGECAETAALVLSRDRLASYGMAWDRSYEKARATLVDIFQVRASDRLARDIVENSKANGPEDEERLIRQVQAFAKLEEDRDFD